MLKCEGYKMFKGIMRITPINAPNSPRHFDPWEEEGVWLYKPEYDCWYGNGSSYVAKICTVVKDYTDGI